MLTIEQTAERKESAQKIIRRHMLFSAGLGFIPFPILDAVAILGNQVLMISDLSDLYEIPFKKHRVKSFIGSLVGNLGTIGFVKMIPGLGSLLGGATVSAGATAATYALGKIFIQHFDQGGTLLNFDPVKSRKYFQQLHEEGKSVTQNLKEEKEVIATKSSTIQNLRANVPFVAVKKRDAEWDQALQTPSAPVPTPQKVVKQAVTNKPSKPVPKEKRSILSQLKWLFFLVLISVLTWVGWQSYKNYAAMDASEATPSASDKEKEVTKTEKTTTVVKPVRTKEDSTKIGD